MSYAHDEDDQPYRRTAGLGDELYACGPANGPFERAAARKRGKSPQPRFLEAVLGGLAEIGVPKGRAKTEAWG